MCLRGIEKGSTIDKKSGEVVTDVRRGRFKVSIDAGNALGEVPLVRDAISTAKMCVQSCVQLPRPCQVRLPKMDCGSTSPKRHSRVFHI